MPSKTKHNNSKHKKYNSDSDNNSDSDIGSDEEITDNDIKNIIFKPISDKCSYGKYGEFNVILMNKNGYINVTKLCNDANKHFYHWNQNNNFELLEAVSEVTDVDVDDLTIVIRGGK
jgi:hypothetical protein